MSKIYKPGKPSEVPLPGREPEISPDPPLEPLAPGQRPEINPEKEPQEPSPPELPTPEKEAHGRSLWAVQGDFNT